MTITYYIIHPRGRQKLKATSERAALEEFKNHWSASADWLKGKKPLVRRLVREVSEEVLVQDMAPEHLV